MNTNIYIYTAILIIMLAVPSVAALGQGNYSAGELDELMAPIALYPDPLLAQIFPAATYLDQLKTAAQFSGGTSAIDSQSWDVSVKAVAHYPEVLDMMVKNPDWTIAIGQAYVNQPADVMKSVQRLREKAKLNGNLTSNAQQQVTTANGAIAIVPTQPQYVYVPQYSSQVYYESAPEYGVSPWVTFGAGLLIGAWLNNAINWNNNNIYYHGWHGGGWVGNSRPHVDWHNNHYVNNNWNNRPVPVDRNINRQNIQPYRNQIHQNVGTYKPPLRPGTYPGAGVRPGVPSTRPAQPLVPGAGRQRPGVVPGTRPAQPARPGAGQRPAMPTVPGAQPTRPGGPGAGVTRPGVVPGTRPAQPARPGAGGQRPSMPNVPSARPTAPSVRPSAPATRPSAPSARPSAPSARPSGPTTRPSAPSARQSRPATRPSGGVSRPSTGRPSGAGSGGQRGGGGGGRRGGDGGRRGR